MKVDIVLPDVQPIETPTQVYLEGMKGYPNARCKPYVMENIAQFQLPLQDFYECGVTRVINQITVSVTGMGFLSLFLFTICTQTKTPAGQESLLPQDHCGDERQQGICQR